METWDTTGFDGLYTLRLVVMENSGNAQTYEAPIAVDNTPPQAQIVHPGKDQLYILETDELVSITADAQDNWEMDRVEFYLDDQKLGEATVSPYSFRWTIKMADKAPRLGPPIMATRTITNPDGTTVQEEFVQSETRADTITRKDGSKVQRIVQMNTGGSGAYMDGQSWSNSIPSTSRDSTKQATRRKAARCASWLNTSRRRREKAARVAEKSSPTTERRSGGQKSGSQTRQAERGQKFPLSDLCSLISAL